MLPGVLGTPSSPNTRVSLILITLQSEIHVSPLQGCRFPEPHAGEECDLKEIAVVRVDILEEYLDLFKKQGLDARSFGLHGVQQADRVHLDVPRLHGQFEDVSHGDQHVLGPLVLASESGDEGLNGDTVDHIHRRIPEFRENVVVQVVPVILQGRFLQPSFFNSNHCFASAPNTGISFVVSPCNRP